MGDLVKHFLLLQALGSNRWRSETGLSNLFSYYHLIISISVAEKFLSVVLHFKGPTVLRIASALDSVVIFQDFLQYHWHNPFDDINH